MFRPRWILALLGLLGAACSASTLADVADRLPPSEVAAVEQLLSRSGRSLEDVPLRRGDALQAEVRDGHVVKLWLNHADIEDMGPVAGLTHLEHLNLSENHIARLDGLDGVRELRSLTISDNPLRDLAGLPPLPSFRYLDAADTRLPDLRGLPVLPALTTLRIGGRSLGSLEGLGPQPRLEDLVVVDSPGLTSLRGIEQATAVERVTARGNGITDANALSRVLSALPDLERVDLRNSRLTEAPTLPSHVVVHLDRRIAPPPPPPQEDPRELFGVFPGTQDPMPAPRKPWVRALPGGDATRRDESRSCRRAGRRVSCDFSVGYLEGHFAPEIADRLREAPPIRTTVRIASGRVRVYGRYGNVFTYDEVTPDAPATIDGLPLRRNDGIRAGVWRIYVHALEPTTGLRVQVRPR